MSENNPNIWRLQAQLDIQGLVEALQSIDPDIRKRAAAALRAVDAPQAIPALRHALEQENDGGVRTSIIAALDALGDLNTVMQDSHVPSESDNLVQRLMEQLTSDDPTAIIHAAEELGEIGDKIAVEPLVMRFRDARLSIQVRLAIAEALLKLESAPVEVTLLATLRNSDWHIRRNGAAILGQLRAEWAIPPLTKALSDAHPIVRRTARAALKHIGTPEARKALAWYTQQTEMKDAPIERPPKTKRTSILDRLSEESAEKNSTQATRQPGDANDNQTPDEHEMRAMPAPPLNRDVLPDAQRHRKAQRPQPRSIEEERKRREKRTQKELSDTARLRHTKETAPLNPDILEQLNRHHQDKRNTEQRNAERGNKSQRENQHETNKDDS